MGFARSVYTLTLCGEKRDSCVCVPVEIMGDSTVTYRKRKTTHNAVVTVDLMWGNHRVQRSLQSEIQKYL